MGERPKTKDDNSLKVVIVGDGAVGKSALLYSYINKDFNEEYIPTVVDVYRMQMSLRSGDAILLDLYDTAGQENFQSLLKANLNGADLIVVCYACNGLASFRNVKNVWVPLVRAQGGIDFILVGTKRDLFLVNNAADCVSYKDAAKMARQVKAKEVVECSAKLYGLTKQKKGNVDKVFTTAVRYALKARSVDPPGTPCWRCSLL